MSRRVHLTAWGLGAAVLVAAFLGQWAAATLSEAGEISVEEVTITATATATKTKKVTKKPKPAPTVTATATRTVYRASRGEARGPSEAQWAALRRCESSGNYASVSASGKYRGAYQFDRQTWAGYGSAGDPAKASPAEQDRRARALYAARGAQPWPVCGRYLR